MPAMITAMMMAIVRLRQLVALATGTAISRVVDCVDMIGSKRCDTCRECGRNVWEGCGDGNSWKVLVGEEGAKDETRKTKFEIRESARRGRRPLQRQGPNQSQKPSQKRREIPPLRKPTTQQEVGL